MTTLQANERKSFKSSSNRLVREKGQIPAIIYGKKIESQPVSVDNIELLKTLRDEGRNTILQLKVGESTHSVMLYDMQKDPLKNQIVHVDFHVVDMQAEIEVEVPVHLVGDAPGVKDGGVLQQPLHVLSISTKPGDIPQSIEVDITNLGVNDTLTIKDVKASGSYKFTQDEDQVIASVLPPKQEEEIDSGEEQEPGQPDKEEGREN
ncbi:50S ribosomal protein L25/general stress protein Ctc [Metabacillus herbersteinensis]|uniref:Large ribosomal subunit protein bL25 n=1 Tax=Metabacillus herbersteinensis TaxID=283816 RepID=A0ABV6GLH3_9BACI